MVRMAKYEDIDVEAYKFYKSLRMNELETVMEDKIV